MTIRFYAACLASYNNGVLHGAWIDAESDVDAMQEQVNAMLIKSRFPNVTVTCPDCEGDGKPYGFNSDSDKESACETCKGAGEVPSAEEWALHDSEGLPRSMGEYPGLEAIAAFMSLVDAVERQTGLDQDESAELAQAMGDHFGAEYAEQALDNFAGLYDSFKDYADESAEEAMAAHCYGAKVPQFFLNYFDYDAWERDLKIEMTYFDCGPRVAVFHP